MSTTHPNNSPPSIITQYDVVVISVIALLAFLITTRAIPQAIAVMREKGIYGIDINKVTLEDRKKFGECKREHKPFPPKIEARIVPESAGTCVGLVYLCSIAAAFVLMPGCPHDRCNAALCSMGFALLLGFVDDVLDVRWRYKIMFSAFTTLPLLNSYKGPLWIAVPIQFRELVAAWFSPSVTAAAAALSTKTTTQLSLSSASSSLTQALATADIAVITEAVKRFIAPYLYDSVSSSSSASASSAVVADGAMHIPGLYLGPVYLIYMALVCIFCTNSINILAGVNGVEVGQTMVICVAQIVHNLLSIYLYSNSSSTPSSASASYIINAENHRLSLIILVPFLGSCLALWRFNRYPSRVFVGDSFTYMAGVVLAVAGITGVYSKTLLLLFFPQLLNFIISLPQLFGIVECPRHRVPRYDPKDGLLHNSRNYTVLNLILAVTGPLKEGTLTTAMLLFQAVSCAVVLWIRHSVASHFFEIVD